MAETENITQRLSDYSTRTNVNAMQTALLDQRLAITEKRVEEYHQRLHKAEDELLVAKTVQTIHDTQINAMRKIVIGNGDRETIPMDMERMERNIQDILKVDWAAMRIRLDELEKYKEKVDSRSWQIWLAIILALVASVLNLVLK